MGGPHASGINVVYADNSAHLIEFEVDPIVWNDLADRQDGGIVQQP
jgi:prepilin-type processing-associated H-X9-DG protein